MKRERQQSRPGITLAPYSSSLLYVFQRSEYFFPVTSSLPVGRKAQPIQGGQQPRWAGLTLTHIQACLAVLREAGLT